MTTLITGASSGLGEEFARLAAADKSDLILVARSVDKLNALAESLARDNGVRAIALGEDLSRPDAVDVIADVLAARAMEVDTLINNAGFATFGPFATTSVAEERQEIDVNVTALTLLTKRLLPGMIARRRGRIMNVASTAAFQPGPLMAVYYATKAYVLSLSYALGDELQGTGVTVTCLCPGPTRTGFQARAHMEKARLFKVAYVMDAASVARVGYRGMKAGRRLVVPGLMNRIGTMSHVLPMAWTARVARLLNKSR